MDSFIAWIGGKRLLRKAVIEEFPADGFDRYIEVFGGAGWVLFAKESHAPLEVFNDVESKLVTLYRCIKYHCGELQKELQYLLNSRELFFDALDQLNTRGLTDIQRAARYYTLIKISYGADKHSFGTIKHNIPKAIGYLPQIQERLKNVVIENRDFEALIRTYDRPTALFYLDPPYFGAERYYDQSFSEDDHRRLSSALCNLKGRFVLSYNDNEFIRTLYNGFPIKEISRLSNLVNKNTPGKKYSEIIIKNF